MTGAAKGRTGRRGRVPASGRRHELGKLIEEATVDCYNEDEAEGGFSVAFEDNVPLPFPAKVIGEDVEVHGFDLVSGTAVARCFRKGKEFKVSVLSLEVPKNLHGRKWLEAYRLFRSRGGSGGAAR